MQKIFPVHPLQHGTGRVYWFGRASITKCHRLGGLNNGILSSHNSGRWKSKTKVLAQLVSSEPSLLGLQMARFLLLLYRVILLCTSSLGVL